MRHFLLDTNHLSDAIKPVSVVREKVERAARRGIRIGTIVPVLCELEAGIRPLAIRHNDFLFERPDAHRPQDGQKIASQSPRARLWQRLI